MIFGLSYTSNSSENAPCFNLNCRESHFSYLTYNLALQVLKYIRQIGQLGDPLYQTSELITSAASPTTQLRQTSSSSSSIPVSKCCGCDVLERSWGHSNDNTTISLLEVYTSHGISAVEKTCFLTKRNKKLRPLANVYITACNYYVVKSLCALFF